MNSKLKWLIFTLVVISSHSVSAQTQVCLDPLAAQFFRDAYYKGQRDSTLLKNCKTREQDYVFADSMKRQQIASYKGDSIGNHALVGNLRQQRRVSLDSLGVVSTNKQKRLKKNSTIKTLIILGLIGITIEKDFLK